MDWGVKIWGSGRPSWLAFSEQSTVEQEAALTNRTLEPFIGSPEYLTARMNKDTAETGELLDRSKVKQSLEFIQSLCICQPER